MSLSLPTYEVPKDAEEYIQSFNISDEQQIKEFFAKFGFVVVNNILDTEDSAATIHEIWKILAANGIEKRNTKTWTNKNWCHTGIFREGIIGNDPFFTKQALLNRQNPKLFQLHSFLLGNDDLLINHDRYGFFRPTKLSLEEDWKTMENIHLDLNPWQFVSEKDATKSEELLESLNYKSQQCFITENNFPGVAATYQTNIQGLYNLSNNKEEDGGFQLVPGFHHHIKEYANSSSPRSGSFNIIRDESVTSKAIRITARAGAVILWDQRVAHGSKPNNSLNPRFAQFFKVFVKPIAHKARLQMRSKKLFDVLTNKGLIDIVTPLGRRVFGLDDLL